MTIDESKTKISQMFTNAFSTIKKENAEFSTFADELKQQLAIHSTSTNTNPNLPVQTETSESDAMVEEFKNTLGTKGALTFFQDYNNEKIEKMIEEKKQELMDKLGLGDATQPPLSGNDRADALVSLDQMMSDFRKQLQEKLTADDKINQQNTMLNTFLQKMG